MRAGWRDRSAARLERALPWLVRALAFSSPLSIALASTAGGLAIGAWAARRVLVSDWRAPRLGGVGVPFVAFLCACALAALLGIDPARSFVGLRTYLWAVLVIVTAESTTTPAAMGRLARWMLAGLGVSALHTVANHYGPFLVFLHLPGTMTESGQLVLGVGLAGALWIDARRPRERAGWLALLALFVLALLFNMKRGAWLGAVSVLVALGASRRRRTVLVAICVALAVLPLYGPARKRLAESGRDFLHADNRLHMWTIASDLVRRYPFGVGSHNGSIMQSARYGPDVPRHRHFHSNAVTILVESGPLGLGAFVWWVAAFGLVAWRTQRALKGGKGIEHAFSLGGLCAFLGWNVAGLLEFNFGDSEIVLLLYLLMGGVLAVHDRHSPPFEEAAGRRLSSRWWPR